MTAPLLALWLLALALGAPGQISFDSAVQLLEGHSGHYGGNHPPLMSALLGLFDRVVPGTALYLLAASALFYLSLMALAAGGGARRRGHWLAAVLLLLALATPLLLIYQGIIWKDVLFANLAVCGFACLALAERPGISHRRQCRLLLAAALAAGLAAATRQNGLVVPLLGAVAVGVAAGRQGRAATRWGLGWLVLALGLYLGAQQAVQATAAQPIGNGLDWGLRVLHRYDIAGMVAHGAPMPDQPVASAEQKARWRDAILRHYSPSRVDTLGQAPELNAFLRQGTSAGMTEQWWRMLRGSPWAWVQHRAAVFRWMVLPPELGRCLPVHLGVEGPPEALASLGLVAGLRPQDLALYGYARAWFGTPLFLNLSWLGVATALLALLLRRRCRQPGDTAMAALLAATLGFAASFAFIGIACDVRYLFVAPAAVCAALAHLARPAPLETTHARN